MATTTRFAHRSTTAPLSVLMAGLVVYASLYPFTGWRWPGVASLWDVLQLPWPRWHDNFDIGANLMGYMPLGGLLVLAGIRSGQRLWPSCVLALALPSTLSYAMELTQHFLPHRYPSLMDWSLNTAGALLGVGLAIVLQWLGLIDAWQAARERWFIPHSRGALVLLLLWPLGLLFPLPVPLGMGPSWERVQDVLIGWLLDVPWAQAALEMVSDVPLPDSPLPRLLESVAIMLGLLGPALLGFAVTRAGWRRLVLVLALLAAAVGASTLSTAMNFGPAHAVAWMANGAWPALMAASVLAVAGIGLSQRLSAALGMVALAGLMMLVAQAPADPYYALSLQAWEQGRFIHFHGLAQWVGWLWPLAAMIWLGGRVARVDAPRWPAG